MSPRALALLAVLAVAAGLLILALDRGASPSVRADRVVAVGLRSGQAEDLGALEIDPAGTILLASQATAGIAVPASGARARVLFPPDVAAPWPWTWTHGNGVALLPLAREPIEVIVQVGGPGALIDIEPGPLSMDEEIPRQTVTVEPLSVVRLPGGEGARLTTTGGRIVASDPRRSAGHSRGVELDGTTLLVPPGRCTGDRGPGATRVPIQVGASSFIEASDGVATTVPLGADDHEGSAPRPRGGVR